MPFSHETFGGDKSVRVFSVCLCVFASVIYDWLSSFDLFVGWYNLNNQKSQTISTGEITGPLDGLVRLPYHSACDATQ